MKYILIDSNQYRHLFSTHEGFSDTVYELLIKLADSGQVSLLLPQQIKDEVERNRYRGWPEAEVKNINAKIKSLKDLIDKKSEDLAGYKSYTTLKNEFESEISRLSKEAEKISTTFVSNRSKATQKLRKIFNKAISIPETDTIKITATTRFQKGNPPYNDNLGDALIWESAIDYLNNFKRSNLIFVTNDKHAWGETVFDPFLQNEYKMKVKGKVLYINKLSDIPDLTADEQEKIRAEELENSKRNAISDFINSQSFVDAGSNADRLLTYKELLGTNDYEEVLRSSLENHEIYQSFFTSIPLTELITGVNGYVVPEVEKIDSDLWKRFVKRFEISLKRQSDSLSLTSPINNEDIPF